MYIDETIHYTVTERTFNEAFLCTELQFAKQSNIIRGVIHRQHNSAERFLDYFKEAFDRYSATGKLISLLGNVNLNILAQQFLDALLPAINKPRRVYICKD